MGVPHTQNRVLDADRLHQRGRRGRGGGRPTPALLVRVLPSSVPRHRRRPRLLQPQTKQLAQHLKAAELLGVDESRGCQYW